MSVESPADLLGERRDVYLPRIYFAHDTSHLDEVAGLLMDEEVVAFPYNGPYAFLARYGSEAAMLRIYEAKERPHEKKLVTVGLPEHWHERIDFSAIAYSQEQISRVVHNTHALGMILPVHQDMHYGTPTEIMMWTDYEPLKRMYDLYRGKGGTLLHATSVNKSGQPTNVSGHEVIENFRYDKITAVVQDVVNQPEPRRMGSTSILDMTKGDVPILHRLGNVSKDEIDLSLMRAGLPESRISDNLIVSPLRSLTEGIS